MGIWFIEPHDPVIFRDGRPFGATPGIKATTLPFPFPATIAGGVRTRAGLDKNGVFQIDKANIDGVKKISIKGPFLVELNGDATGDISNWLVPAPLDAVLLNIEPEDKTKAKIKHLVPINIPENSFTDLQTRFSRLSLVGMPLPDLAKPHGNAPRFWYWDKFEEWLLKAEDKPSVVLSSFGHNGPEQEFRTHVKINPETQTSEESALFQTRALEFTRAEKGFVNSTPLAIALETQANITKGLAAFGGERRIVFWNKSESSLPFSECSEKISKEIIETGSCRVILLTPGYFDEICKPNYLLQPFEGLSPVLSAIAVARPQVISGWDFEKNKPKPTKRLAPAGTVFFLKLGEPKELDKKLVEKWINNIWLNSVSDSKDSRLDGFGLAALGTWSGKIKI